MLRSCVATSRAAYTCMVSARPKKAPCRSHVNTKVIQHVVLGIGVPSCSALLLAWVACCSASKLQETTRTMFHDLQSCAPVLSYCCCCCAADTQGLQPAQLLFCKQSFTLLTVICNTSATITELQWMKQPPVWAGCL